MGFRLFTLLIVLGAGAWGPATAEPTSTPTPAPCRVEGVILGSGVRVAPCLEPESVWALRSFHLARADGAGMVQAIAAEQVAGGVRFALHGGGRDGGQLSVFAEYEAVPGITHESRLKAHRNTLWKRIKNLEAVEAALAPLLGNLTAKLAEAEGALQDLKARSEALRTADPPDPEAVSALESQILEEAARVAGIELQESGVRTNLERTRALKAELGRALAATEDAIAKGEGPATDREASGRENAPALVPEGEPALELPHPGLAILLKDCATACEAPVAGWSEGDVFLLRGFAVASDGFGGAFTNLEIRPVPSRRSVIVKFGGAGETLFDARIQYALVSAEVLSSATGEGRGRNPGLSGAEAEPANAYWTRMTLKTDAGAQARVALRGFALAFERRPRPLGEIGVLRQPRLGASAQAVPELPSYRFVLRDNEAVDPVVWAAEYAVLR